VRRTATILIASVTALAGCGGGDDSAGKNTGVDPDPNPSDKRAVALDCIVNDEGIDARFEGKNVIQVGDDRKRDPRIEFYVTQGEAEGKQFAGDAQGAEQIGSALLYVREADDELLEKLERCLDNV
jgi:hypothetical protein